MRFLSEEYFRNDLIHIKELLEVRGIDPVIDGCYMLDKTPEAFLCFEKEHPKEKVVIEVC